MDSTKSDDPDIDMAFTRYATTDHAEDLDDDPPSSPDSDGGKNS